MKVIAIANIVLGTDIFAASVRVVVANMVACSFALQPIKNLTIIGYTYGLD